MWISAGAGSDRWVAAAESCATTIKAESASVMTIVPSLTELSECAGGRGPASSVIGFIHDAILRAFWQDLKRLQEFNNRVSFTCRQRLERQARRLGFSRMCQHRLSERGE